jgi:protein-L-isoaspartate O-methyltransferase
MCAYVRGWIVPPPKEPTKSRKEFKEERTARVRRLEKQGYLRSERIKQALLKAPREDFIPQGHLPYLPEEMCHPRRQNGLVPHEDK